MPFPIPKSDHSNTVLRGAAWHELTSAAGLREVYQVLASLNLSDAEIDSLRKQGFVSRDLHRGKQLYKLRFRHEGRQRVRCIDDCKVAAVQIELSLLQAGVRRTRRLATFNRHVRQEIRASVRQLVPIVEEFGYHLHGRQLRRRRQAKPC